MKKLPELWPVAAFLALLAMAGCQPQPVGASDYVGEGDIHGYADPNGCQYIIWEGANKGGITPRMRPDGKQECGQ